MLHDLKSTNGTFVNGNRINEATLKEADKILIGSTINTRFGWSDAIDLQYQNEIDNLLNIDELTGLIVKRRFDEELNRYIAVAASKGADLAMIMIDIDGVKKDQTIPTATPAFFFFVIFSLMIKNRIDDTASASASLHHRILYIALLHKNNSIDSLFQHQQAPLHIR